MNVKVEKLIVYWEEKNVTNLSGEKSFGVLELRVLQYLRKNSIITAYCTGTFSKDVFSQEAVNWVFLGLFH